MQTNTLSTALDKAFDVKSFRDLGHQMIDLLSDHLEKVRSAPDRAVIPYREPEEELKYWQVDAQQLSEPMDLFQNILDHSIDVHHGRYMGHQVSAPAFISALAGLMSDVLSNGTGVYEMGMASNALEKVVTDFVARKIGYRPEAAGFQTSGGSLANLTALLAARKAKAPTAVWEEGHADRLAVMVSAEAHYCIDRAARILGMGSEGLIKVPVNDRFEIRTDLLDNYLQEAQAKGLRVIAMIGCAGSTATGSYDDLEALADFSQRHKLWLHIDGAHGGAVVFSEQYRHLVKGIERADSVVIDFHKMLLTPALNTALIFKEGENSYKTFEQQAQYLWDSQQSPEWYHSGKRTFECTKLMLSIKVYAILKTYGEEIFAENIDRLYGLAKAFAGRIKEHPYFELATEPAANIVNFRYTNAPSEKLDQLNADIRQALIDSGKFYIVQTMIDGKRYLRTTFMNPRTKEMDVVDLLAEIEAVAA